MVLLMIMTVIQVLCVCLCVRVHIKQWMNYSFSFLLRKILSRPMKRDTSSYSDSDSEVTFYFLLFGPG